VHLLLAVQPQTGNADKSDGTSGQAVLIESEYNRKGNENSQQQETHQG